MKNNNQILVLNSGSTSLKYKLFDLDLKEVENGFVEDIGNGKIRNHTQALQNVLKKIGNTENIKYVGHRVVHGGDKFYNPIVVGKRELKEIEKMNHLAPLHNPANLEGIRASMNLIKDAKNIAVFDTAFYKDLPEHAYLYAIPKEFYKKYGIRRYGFHGTSHKHVMLEAAKKLNKSISNLNLITCHLGGGASITAIKKGKAIDTSMGFTPMEGLPMETRAGDIDSGIVLELLKSKNIKLNDRKNRIDAVDHFLNKQSGLSGLAGKKANNIYEIAHLAELGDKEMMDILKLYTYKIKKYIGAYKAILGNVDAIVFTGTVGCRSKIIRKLILTGFKDLKNIKKLVIQTNEELMIAREIIRLIK
ncbi:MAG: acetate/propionate family kinase [Candidatus Pacebacteria bacterium]|nr:acetate/propionate family kinase [Candidatus Paceibacterota bacterium]